MPAITDASPATLRADAAAAGALSWSEAGAADYLEARAEHWLDRRPCALSCHTTHPYLMVEPLLAGGVSDTGNRIRAAITERVTDWDAAAAWYDSSETKVRESRATEAVLNAFALASFDTRAGELSATTRLAFEHMFAAQRADGGWDWLNFDLQPWESPDFEYGGAALAIIAVAIAPGDYLATGAPVAKLDALRGYLVGRRDEINVHNRLMLLWASSVVSGLASAAELETILVDVVAVQNADGSWATSALGTWTRKDGTANPAPAAGDGYATGLAVHALSAIGAASTLQAIERGARWLAGHQSESGAWEGRSLNDDDEFNAGLATDAATAFAVLGLMSAASR